MASIGLHLLNCQYTYMEIKIERAEIKSSVFVCQTASRTRKQTKKSLKPQTQLWPIELSEIRISSSDPSIAPRGEQGLMIQLRYSLCQMYPAVSFPHHFQAPVPRHLKPLNTGEYCWVLPKRSFPLSRFSRQLSKSLAVLLDGFFQLSKMHLFKNISLGHNKSTAPAQHGCLKKSHYFLGCMNHSKEAIIQTSSK